VKRRTARALMIQGTGSHAGKTVLVAGLCRLLSRRGLRVAPFKSQNMSLNASVTAAGGEMGWAQVMQAEAAGIAPQVEMNPILLKPHGERRSQVVRLGRVFADTGASEYFQLTAELWPVVAASYHALARSVDAVLIEGAGSPAEPNLMRRDIANMRVARLARAPVVVVGDIGRGGVFASLVGTMAILPPRDRARVRGFVINKFRGDASLLSPAMADLRRRTGKRVLGVVPFLQHLGLPEEDSVALDERPRCAPAGLCIAVVRLPNIANFTDFAPLESEPGVRLRYVDEASELGGAALVVLPGTKDTIADLRAIKSRGFPSAIRAHLDGGGQVLGICGGYQMLGRSVEDPHGVESGGSEGGLGLLPVDTALARDKATRRVRARWLPDGPEFDAYEIHMGVTARDEGTPPLAIVDGVPDGAASADDRVRGTYLHGLFDSAASRRRLLDWARKTPARSAVGGLDGRTVREAAYERLADAMEAALDPSLLAALGV